MKTRLKLWAALVLCLCAMLLCGSAMTEGQQYTASVANFGQLVPNTCERIVLYDRSNEYISEEGGALFVEPTKMIGVRIYPQANCSVVSVVCNKEDYGVSSSLTLDLQSIDGGVSTWFTMPFGNVSLEIIMAVNGVVRYEASFTGTGCDSATLTSSGGETGSTVRAAAGETIAITVVPLQGYDQLAMTYTTRSNPVSVPLVCARNEDGSFTAEVVMPDEPLYITAEASMTPVRYISYDESGNLLGEKECTTYRKITSGNPTWLDLDDSLEGWYVVDANVTLGSDATIRVTGDVKLLLCDGVTLTVGNGIYIKKGSSLSIYGQSGGTGKLVSKPDHGPGIGGMADTVGGSLYIHGGVIEVQGGPNAAGIGGGNHESGYQNIVIYGGTVTAQGGSSGAGIGKGQQNSPSDCGLIAIYGGTVTATGGPYAAGIGGSEDRDGGTIRIYGGTVKAIGGHDGAGIGGGEMGTGGNIAIYGGTVESQGGDNGAGIGGGEKSSGGTIAIHGGNITGSGGPDGAGIGGGKNGSSGQITIDAGTVHANAVIRFMIPSGNASGEYEVTTSGAGIGGGEWGGVGSITISGGHVIAKAGDEGAGAAIGSGAGEACGGSITISGGIVEAAAYGGAAIGSGRGDDLTGTITITNGTVTATSAIGSGIGAGGGGNFKGTVRINGGTVRAASTGRSAGIGAGAEFTLGEGGENEGTIEITGGTVIASSSSQGNGRAIGRGNGGDKEGTLILGDMMSVMASNDPGGADAVTAAVSERVSVCRKHYARIEACEHSGKDYTLPPDDAEAENSHIWHCLHCKEEGTEAHHFVPLGEKQHCENCGYTGYKVTVTYEAGSTHAEGAMDPDIYAGGTAHPAADCEFTFNGYEFNGWQVKNTDVILATAEEYTFNNDTTLIATWRNSWTELQTRIDSAPNGAVIVLDDAVTSSDYDGCLTIPNNKSITLDLNGHTLARVCASPKDAGYVLYNSGYLTITDSVGDGVITGGKATTNWGAGGILSYGTLTITGGTITGNESTSGAGAIKNFGTLNLSGGTITGNVSGGMGGGIFNYGTLNLSGGTVTGNTAASYGGGIYALGKSTVNLSGAPVVTGNTSGSLGENNLHVGRDNNGTATVKASNLAEGIQVGLSGTEIPAVKAPVTLVTGTADSTAGLFSDKEDYLLLIRENTWILCLNLPFDNPDFTLPADITAIEESAFECADMSAVYIHDGCGSIGDHAFRSCPNLTQIRIPAGCSLGTDVFDGCELVYVYSTAGSPVEAYCVAHDNCVFVPAE